MKKAPKWIKVGMKVNLHGIIGEPPTKKGIVWCISPMYTGGDEMVYIEGLGAYSPDAVSLIAHQPEREGE